MSSTTDLTLDWEAFIDSNEGISNHSSPLFGINNNQFSIEIDAERHFLRDLIVRSFIEDANEPFIAKIKITLADFATINDQANEFEGEGNCLF